MVVIKWVHLLLSLLLLMVILLMLMLRPMMLPILADDVAINVAITIAVALVVVVVVVVVAFINDAALDYLLLPLVIPNYNSTWTCSLFIICSIKYHHITGKIFFWRRVYEKYLASTQHDAFLTIQVLFSLATSLLLKFSL